MQISAFILSLFSIMVAITSLLHNISVAYPNVQIKAISPQYFEIKKFLTIIFNEETSSAYLLLKVDAHNYSPQKGNLCYCSLNLSSKKLVPALSQDEFQSLPESAKAQINALNFCNVNDLNSHVVLNEFDQKRLSFIFKLNSAFINAIYCKKKIHFVCHTFTNKSLRRSKKLNISLENLDKQINPEKVLDSIQKQEALEQIYHLSQKFKTAEEINKIAKELGHKIEQ